MLFFSALKLDHFCAMEHLDMASVCLAVTVFVSVFIVISNITLQFSDVSEMLSCMKTGCLLHADVHNLHRYDHIPFPRFVSVLCFF